MRRSLTWLLLLPFAATNVVVGHAIAYRVAGVPADNLHGYLAHAPQILLILATLALVGLAADARARRRSPLPPAALAVSAFVVQEHLERVIHTGHVPFLLTSPVLWIGIALQLPLAIAVWLVARSVADDLAVAARRPLPRIALLPLAEAPLVGRAVPALARAPHPARGPPSSS